MRGGVAALGLLVSLGAVVPAPPAGADVDRVHVVQPGETLWQIAAVLTGDPHRWPELYRANRDQIKDPSTLYPGQRLAIPDFDEPATEPRPAPPPVTGGTPGSGAGGGDAAVSASP